jgi:mannosyl-3-phosphoglycerate phosphatase
MEMRGVDLTAMLSRIGRASAASGGLIVFTDLDGTLLDGSYSYYAATEALTMIREKDIPLVLCSSKTRAEIEHYQDALEISAPFVAENGGAIVIPRGYFSPRTEDMAEPDEVNEQFLVMRLGADYRELRRILIELRARGFDVRGFGDMSVAEIADITGLPAHEAFLAARREFDEPFILRGNVRDAAKIEKIIRESGFRLTRAAFFHISGQTDKGRAVSVLIDMYRRERGNIITIALGDNPSDLPMLQCVDVPIIVQKPDGSYDPSFEGYTFYQANGIGPEGWNDALLTIIDLCTVTSRS